MNNQRNGFGGQHKSQAGDFPEAYIIHIGGSREAQPCSLASLRHALCSFKLSTSSRFFRNESVLCIRWPKHWNFSFRNSLSNEYSGLISFRMVWLALLAVQGIFKNLLQQPQFKSINSSLLSFLYSPTLNPYMTNEKKHSFDKTDL